MQSPSSKKNLIIVIVVLIIAAGAYFYMSGSTTNNDAGLTANVPGINGGPAQAGTSEVGTRVLVLLKQVNGLKIDATFFKSQAYSSLVDHTVPIYDQNIGKTNPFIYRSAPVVITQATTSSKSATPAKSR